MIVETLFMIASYGLIWGAWGFWAFIGACAGKLFLARVCKPEYDFQINWGDLIGNIIILFAGLCAVNSIWANPVITALAIAVVIICFVVAFKK